MIIRQERVCPAFFLFFFFNALQHTYFSFLFYATLLLHFYSSLLSCSSSFSSTVSLTLRLTGFPFYYTSVVAIVGKTRVVSPSL